MNKKIRDWAILLVIFFGVWFTPTPEGLKPEAWHLFAMFITVVVGYIVQPIPMGAISLVGLSAVCLLNILSIKTTLAFYGNNSLWLIVSAFFFAIGFIKTGLGRRVAYMIIRVFGKKTLTLAYSLSVADLILGPAMPSNTARAGGVLFPIVESLNDAYDSRPGKTANKLGAFLLTSVFQVDMVVSAMFLTSMAGNPLAASLAEKALGITISWGGWIMATVVPGLILMILLPIVIFFVMRPTVTSTPQAPELAKEELVKMGAIKQSEIFMAIIFVGAIILWATASITAIDNTLVALTGVACMLLTKVIDWDDIISNKSAWDTLIWMGFIIGLADELNKSGFITWFANIVASQIDGFSWMLALTLTFVVYMLFHYGFASTTAQITAMYVTLVAVAVKAGAPPFVAAILLAVAANLCGGLTHYGSGPAPIYFGAGYVSQNKWWGVGLISAIVTSAVFLIVGPIWWKLLGLW